MNTTQFSHIHFFARQTRIYPCVPPGALLGRAFQSGVTPGRSEVKWKTFTETTDEHLRQRKAESHRITGPASDNQKVKSQLKCLTKCFSENPKQPWKRGAIPPRLHLRHELMDRFIYSRYTRLHTNLPGL